MRMRRRTLVAATVALAGLMTVPAHAAQQPSPAPTTRQEAFAAAAKVYHVPEKVLLAVAYLESRWDANGGRPSVGAGYGPMHLTDATLTPSGEHLSGGGEDPRGD